MRVQWQWVGTGGFEQLVLFDVFSCFCFLEVKYGTIDIRYHTYNSIILCMYYYDVPMYIKNNTSIRTYNTKHTVQCTL